jgi:hypothetical protein
MQNDVRASTVKAEQVEVTYNKDILLLNSKMDKMLENLMDVNENQIIMKSELQQINTNLTELNDLHRRTNE